MKLKELRLNNQKKQIEVANAINTTQFTYSNYENEKTEPDIPTLIKIADYFDVSLDYLCDRQWNNQIGYIPENKKEAVKVFLQLNEINTIKALSYACGLLATQN